MKKSKLVRSTSMIMAVMMVALTFFSTFVMPAGAAFSLPYIEEIKESKQNGGSAYKIVEIAPTVDTGNMGYYVDGQEPGNIAGWSTRITGILNAGERINYVNNILNSLKNTGLMSSDTNGAPLHLSGTYAEHYAWDTDAATYIGNKATIPANKLTLDQTETFLTKGEIIEMPDETGGDYNLTYDYYLAQGGNLFVYSKWRASNSARLNGNATAGDTLTFDDENKSFTVKTDGTGGGSSGTSNDVFCNDSMANGYYTVKVKPNSKYTVSYDVETTGGNSQFFVFAADSSRSYGSSSFVLSTNNGKYQGTYNKTGHYEYTFYTGTNARYFSFRFGTTAANSSAKFSNISLYKISEENLFDYTDWYNTSSKEVVSGIGTASYDTANGSVTVASTTLAAATRHEATDGYYTIPVEPNTTYNFSYVNTISTGSNSSFAIYVSGEAKNTAAASGNFIKSATSASLSGVTYRIYSEAKGYHTVTLTTGADAKYITLGFGTMTINTTTTIGNIWVTKVKQGFNTNAWLNSVTTSDNVTKTSNSVSLTSTALTAGDTNSTYVASTFDKDATYTLRFRVTFDNEKTTNNWKQGYAAIYVNGANYVSKYFSVDGIYELSVDTANWMSNLKLDFHTGSPKTSFTISEISVTSSVASEETEEELPEFVQDIQYFEYGEPEVEYGNNIFSLSKWATNTNSFALGNSTSGDKLYKPDYEANSVRITEDGSGGNDMYTCYGNGTGYYFMNADPNTTYRLTFKLRTDAGQGQFYVFPFSSGIVQKYDNSGATVTPEGGSATWAMGFRHKTSGVYSQVFTTSSDTLYLQIRLGTDASNSDVTFSDISIQKIENPVNYYYNVVPTEYSYYMKDENGNRIVPDDNTELYTLNDEGHYEYYGTYKKDGSGVKIFTDVHYYSLEIADDCWPVDEFNEGQPYRAVSDSFRKAQTTYDDDGNVIGKEKAYFTRDYGTLTYIGNGAGNANVNTAGTDDLTILSSIVYYTGGYENNDWFWLRVLDADDTKEVKDDNGNVTGTVPKYDFPITVTTITPDDENLENTLRTADLIVITGGVDVLGTGEAHYKTTITNPDGTKTTQIKDIPDESIDSIIKVVGNYVSEKMPIIIDTALYTSDDTPDNLLRLIQSVTTENTGKVNGSIYTFSASQVGATALATNKFLTVFGSSSYSTNTAPYYPVYNELDQEDTYRGLRSLTPLTDAQDDINMAAVIRYIINYKKQRLYQTLNSLKVLDIEPISSVPTITVEMINNMLPSESQYDADSINIVTMSVAEFVGKNENFEEEYDLVYIGSSTANHNVIEKGTDTPFTFSYRYKTDDDSYETATATVTNGEFDETYLTRAGTGLTRKLKVGSPIYNDESLNGYYYSNVGDTITTVTNSTLTVENGIEYPPLSGLLKEDYVNIGDTCDEMKEEGGFLNNIGSSVLSSVASIAGDVNTLYWVKGGHATFRTTGADLNQTALDKLQDYINAGRPVIISDELTTSAQSLTFSATSTVKMEGPVNNVYTFTFNCKIDQALPEGTFVTYQWFKDGVAETSAQSSGTFVKSVTAGKVSYDADGNYTFTFNGAGKYYCEAVVTYNGITKTVVSNNCYVNSGRDQYNMYLRATKTGERWGWGVGKRDVYNYYVDKSDGIPDGWWVTYDWYYDQYSVFASWSGSQSNDSSWSCQAKEVKVLMTFHYKDETGTEQTLAMKVKKYGGSGTNELYTRIDGDNDTSQKNEAGQLYKWRDMSTGTHTRNDGHATYNNWADKNGGFDVPFVYTLGNINVTTDNAKKTVVISMPSEINTDTVDNCSYMYQFLISNYYRDKATKNGADNMFNVKDGVADTNKLASCLKISKPELEFLTQPNEYPSQLTSHSLDFKFYIRDNSNPKDNVTYTSWVYIDLNGDGKFSEYEKQVGKKIDNHPISKGKENHICTLSLPTNNLTGLIAWKLEVKENVDTTSSYQGSTSYTGYSYIKPSTDDPIKINAIMILPGGWSSDYRKLSDMIANKDSITVDGKNYVFKNNVADYWGANEYIGNVFESEVFDGLDNLKRLTNEELGVGDDGIGNDGLYHMGFNVNNGDIIINIAVTNIHDMNKKFTADPESTFFESYGMMIMGFGDDWGKTTATWNDDLLGVIDNTIPEGFEIETAEAVCQYINDGYQTLFCHDTLNKNVNFVNLIWDKVKGVGTNAMSTMMRGVNWLIDNILNPVITAFGGRPVSSYNITDDNYKDSRVKNGYWNNLIMRDTLGLDRYGITYAIKHRAKAIDEGRDTDKHNADYQGDGMYANSILGRAHMYEYIYDYQYEDMSVEKMLEMDYSVAYVPGSAEVFKRPDDSTDMTIYVEDRAMKSDEEVVKIFGENSDNPIKLVANATVTYSNQYINDTDNRPDIYRKNGEMVEGKYYDIKDGKIVSRKKTLGIWSTGDQIDDLQLDGNLLVDGNNNPVQARIAKYTNYAYLGKVYEKVTEVTVDDFDDTFTTTYHGAEAPKTLVNGKWVYTVYDGQPVCDTNGNPVATWDEYTQGFTDYVLQRYIDPSEDQNRLGIRPIWEDNEFGQTIETDKITQVNRGKITTYPYDINNDDMFDINGKTTEETQAAMNKTYDVYTTHEQVYQCNMNGDDITVWYALSGGQYYDAETNTGVRNDCGNAYFIYSRDNLIYTGAGHTNQFSEMEAKLFINTLVASYREPVTAPTFAYKNKYDTSNVKYALVLPSVNADNEVSLVSNDYIYFKLDDQNTTSKTLSVDFYYIDNDGNQVHLGANEVPLLVEKKNGDGSIVYTTKIVNGKEVEVPLMESASGENNSTSINKLNDTMLYAFEIPDSIIDRFENDSSLTTIKLYATPSVTVNVQTHKKDTLEQSNRSETKVGETQVIEIRVLHLSDLS